MIYISTVTHSYLIGRRTASGLLRGVDSRVCDSDPIMFAATAAFARRRNLDICVNPHESNAASADTLVAIAKPAKAICLVGYDSDLLCDLGVLHEEQGKKHLHWEVSGLYLDTTPSIAPDKSILAAVWSYDDWVASELGWVRPSDPRHRRLFRRLGNRLPAEWRLKVEAVHQDLLRRHAAGEDISRKMWEKLFRDQGVEVKDLVNGALVFEIPGLKIHTLQGVLFRQDFDPTRFRHPDLVPPAVDVERVSATMKESLQRVYAERHEAYAEIHRRWDVHPEPLEVLCSPARLEQALSRIRETIGCHAPVDDPSHEHPAPILPATAAESAPATAAIPPRDAAARRPSPSSRPLHRLGAEVEAQQEARASVNMDADASTQPPGPTDPAMEATHSVDTVGPGFESVPLPKHPTRNISEPTL